MYHGGMELKESPKFKVQRSKISAGPEGGRWSIKKTAELAKENAKDPFVRAWTIQQIHKAKQGGAPTKSKKDVASIILAAVQREFTYVEDPAFVEMMVAPKWMVQGIFPGGDCDDLVGLVVTCFLSALSSAGIRCAVIGHSYDTSKAIQHVLCAIYINKKWYYADPCTDLPLGETFAPHTWELVYDPIMPQKPFCDAESCLVGPRPTPPPAFKESHGDFVGVQGLPTDNAIVIDPEMSEDVEEVDMTIPLKSANSLLREIEKNPSEKVIHCRASRWGRPSCSVEISETEGPATSPAELLRSNLPYQIPTPGGWPLDMTPVAPMPVMVAVPPFRPWARPAPQVQTSCGSCGAYTCGAGTCSSCGASLVSNPIEDRGNFIRNPRALPRRIMKRPIFAEQTEDESFQLAQKSWTSDLESLKNSVVGSLRDFTLAYEYFRDTCQQLGIAFPPDIPGYFGPSEQAIINDSVEFLNASLAILEDALAGTREVVFTEFNAQPVMAIKSLATDAFRYVAGSAISSLGFQAYLPKILSSADTTVGTASSAKELHPLFLALPIVSGAAVILTIAMIKNTQGTLDFMRNAIADVTRFLSDREMRKMVEAGASPKEVQALIDAKYKGELNLRDKEIERQRVDNERLKQENESLHSLINKGIFVLGAGALAALGFWAWKNFGGHLPAKPPSSRYDSSSTGSDGEQTSFEDAPTLASPTW